MVDYILKMEGIVKEFPGVKALDGVSFSVKRGEIHALCGENGAGKSTLMKILSGIYPEGTYTGDIMIDGKKISFQKIKDSEQTGISVIYQELALVPELSIAENIYLGNEFLSKGLIDWDRTLIEAAKWLEQVGLDVNPNEKVKNLGVGQQQLVEIAKALSKENKMIILDEPTAALTETEVETLITLLENLRNKGVTCIYISHKLNEVMRLCDSVTILRDGKTIVTKDIHELNEDKIISYMVGRELTQLYPMDKRVIGKPMLEVKNYSVIGTEGKQVIQNVSFTVHQGEILGISGLMGSGRTELFTSIFGAYEGTAEGEVKIDGHRVTIGDTAAAVKHGLAYVPEDRKKTGLVLGASIKENTIIASIDTICKNGIVDESKGISAAEKYMKMLRTKANSIHTIVGTLSGGNQQKVVLGKWMMTAPKVLILDEPTRGIDIGAKSEIYNIMNQLAKEGLAIIMISSELPEVLGMSDRVLVMSEGTAPKILTKDEADQPTIMKWATRGKEHVNA